MAQSTEQTSDPRHHARNIQEMLEDVITHARKDVERVDDPRAEALFETTAEVLEGLQKAYRHFEERSEAAWRSN